MAVVDEVSKKPKASEWSNASVAFATLSEVILVSFLILMAAQLMEGEMMTWVDTIIASSADYMAGGYVDEPSQEPWEAPGSWGFKEQHLLVTVKDWLTSVATRTGGVLAPIIEIFLVKYKISLSSSEIYKWARRLCAPNKSTNPKPLLVPSFSTLRRGRLAHMLPAVARYLKLNLVDMKIQLEAAEDSLEVDDVTLGSPNRTKAQLKVEARRLEVENAALVAENKVQVRTLDSVRVY